MDKDQQKKGNRTKWIKCIDEISSPNVGASEETEVSEMGSIAKDDTYQCLTLSPKRSKQSCLYV